MTKDNEKLIQQIINQMGDTLISKIQLEEILCDVIRRFRVEKIDDKKYNLKEILEFYKEDMKMQEFSKNTIKNRMYTLNCICDFINKDVEDITIIDLKAFLNFKKKTTQASTINGYIDLMKSFFCWCVEEGYIETNPAKKLRKLKQIKKVREPLSVENIERLRMACKTNRERALVEVLLSTGMRISEVQKVNISDIDFYANKIKIMGKGNKERIILFNDKCKLYLMEYLKNRKENQEDLKDNEALFISDRKPFGRIGTRGLEKILKKYLKEKFQMFLCFLIN